MQQLVTKPTTGPGETQKRLLHGVGGGKTGTCAERTAGPHLLSDLCDSLNEGGGPMPADGLWANYLTSLSLGLFKR